MTNRITTHSPPMMPNASEPRATDFSTAPLVNTSHASHDQRQPIGRFAPSPTGELHLGSLTTALASYCQIKSIGGLWRLRIEDTDHERCDEQFSEQILLDLEALGLYWDFDVIYQSERLDIYNEFLNDKLAPLTYACSCSRKQLMAFWDQHSDNTPVLPNAQTTELPFDHDPKSVQDALVRNQRYPRLCLHKKLAKSAHKLRIQLPEVTTGFLDGIQGLQWQNPQQSLGDMVVKRADGMINYILAASIDDGLQNISHVMRGLDILPMTSAQIAIMAAANLPSVDHWYHLPLICHADGQKLSKQNLATPIDTSNPSALIQQALSLLNQPTVDLDTPERMLAQAVAQWDNQPLQHVHFLTAPKAFD